MSEINLKIHDKENGEQTTDPRWDLKKDHMLWVDVLNLAFKRNKEVYWILHSLRISESRLAVNLLEKKLDFNFGPQENLPKADKKYTRKKYVTPNEYEIMMIFKTVYEKHRNSESTLEQAPF